MVVGIDLLLGGCSCCDSLRDDVCGCVYDLRGVYLDLRHGVDVLRGDNDVFLKCGFCARYVFLVGVTWSAIIHVDQLLGG